VTSFWCRRHFTFSKVLKSEYGMSHVTLPTPSNKLPSSSFHSTLNLFFLQHYADSRRTFSRSSKHKSTLFHPLQPSSSFVRLSSGLLLCLVLGWRFVGFGTILGRSFPWSWHDPIVDGQGPKLGTIRLWTVEKPDWLLAWWYDILDRGSSNHLGK